MLFKLFQALDVAFYCTGVVVAVKSISVGDEECATITNSVGQGQFLVVNGVDFNKVNACCVQHGLCHLALGASLCGPLSH